LKVRSEAEMKVILQTKLESLGNEGDLVEVKSGYARNFLIPKGLAVPATPGNLKMWEQKKAAIARKLAKEREKAEAIAKEISGRVIEIRAKVGEKERLYGSVTAGDIAVAVKKNLNLKIDKRKIVLVEPIKQLGSHEITVKLHPEVEAIFKVEVVAGDQS
jgi:large subunit ribosomal protein L9